jgi:hypothetical protein
MFFILTKDFFHALVLSRHQREDLIIDPSKKTRGLRGLAQARASFILRLNQPYMECVPSSLIKSADWQLICTDGIKMPCHSLLLSAVSKVYENLHDSTRKPQSGVLIDIPFEESSVAGEAFLTWIYQRTTSHISTPSLSYRMAELGHYLDCRGRTTALNDPFCSLTMILKCRVHFPVLQVSSRPVTI